MIDYRGWQFDDTKNVDLSQEVQNAIENYIKHNGLPPDIIETSRDDLPELELVVHRISIPKNVLFVGRIE